MSHGGAAFLIRAGAFGIDRERALEILKRYQFEDPYRFVAPLIRCAVLAGAGEIRFIAARGGLEAWFDGRALSPETVRDPYEALFAAEDAGRQAEGQLAISLLTASRTEPIPAVRRPLAASHEGLRAALARPAPRVEAHVENDRFTLDIGQSGVVHDAEFDRAMAWLAARAAEVGEGLPEFQSPWPSAPSSPAPGVFPSPSRPPAPGYCWRTPGSPGGHWSSG